MEYDPKEMLQATTDLCVAMCVDGDFEQLKWCVHNGIWDEFNGKSRRFFGDTALHAATRNNNIEIMQFMIDNGTKINSVNYDGDTPLMCAARKGYMEAVQFLVGQIAQLNVRNNKGETALIMAAANGHAAIVSFLLHSGADIDTRTKSNFTALSWAVIQGHTEVVEILRRARADPFIKPLQSNVVWRATSKYCRLPLPIL